MNELGCNGFSYLTKRLEQPQVECFSDPPHWRKIAKLNLLRIEFLQVWLAGLKSFDSYPFFVQTQNRMKLMADNYEDEHLKTGSDQTNHKPSPDQVTAGAQTLTPTCF